MRKVKLDDFTNQELINVIAEWLDSCSLRELAENIRLGAWLDHVNEKLKDEL